MMLSVEWWFLLQCAFSLIQKDDIVDNLQQEFEYLEESVCALRMQNRVLAAALKGFLRALPPDMAQDVVESVQAAFEDEISALAYSDSNDADLFQDAAEEFFRERR